MADTIVTESVKEEVKLKAIDDEPSIDNSSQFTVISEVPSTLVTSAESYTDLSAVESPSSSAGFTEEMCLTVTSNTTPVLTVSTTSSLMTSYNLTNSNVASPICSNEISSSAEDQTGGEEAELKSESKLVKSDCKEPGEKKADLKVKADTEAPAEIGIGKTGKTCFCSKNRVNVYLYYPDKI